jgi:hypothetical protein
MFHGMHPQRKVSNSIKMGGTVRKLVFAALGVVALTFNSEVSTAAAEPAKAEPATSAEGVNGTADLEASAIRVVTLWSEPGFSGIGLPIAGRARPSGGVCTRSRTDIDFRVDLGGTRMNRNAESVDDNPAARCDWQLIDAQGRRSPWVEGDIWDLRNLGSGWRNRAVAIQFT